MYNTSLYGSVFFTTTQKFKMADEMEVDREVAQKPDKMFTLKKWNLVAMWSWDVECDTCAICRVQVMGKLMKDTRPGFKFRLRLCNHVIN